MTKEKADRAGVFFFWLLAHLGFYLVGRELTDLRRQPTHCVHWFIPRVHELVARAMRGECVRQQAKQKVGGFITLRNLSYTTRANIVHEKAEQIRARIVCTPAE